MRRLRAAIIAPLALFLAITGSATAFAAQNGRLGTTSTGSIGVSLVKPPSITVQSASATLLTRTSAVSARGVVDQCVNANLFGGRYSVTGAATSTRDVRVVVRKAGTAWNANRCRGGTLHRFAVSMNTATSGAAASVVSVTYRPE